MDDSDRCPTCGSAPLLTRQMSDEALTAATERLGRRVLEILVVDWMSTDVVEAAALVDAVDWQPAEDFVITMTARITRGLIEHEFGRIPPDMLGHLRRMRERVE